SLTISRLKRWSIYFTGVVVTFCSVLIAMALLALAGWEWDISRFKHPFPALAIMNPVTAMTFMLSGVSLLILIPRRNGRRTTWGRLLASVVFTIAFLRLLSICWPGFWRVDFLLYSDQILNDTRAHFET